MKYFISFSFYFCAAATGAQLGFHNYKLAVVNILGIVFFYYIGELNKKRDL